MTVGAIGNSYFNYGMYGASGIYGMNPSGASEKAAGTFGVNQADGVGRVTGAGRIEGVKPTGIDDDAKKKTGRASSPEECQTCKNRKYQDGSNEADVSFKTAAHVSPEAAGAAVRAHEGQHVSNAYEKAAKGNGKVLRASVSIHTAVCPECGRVYVSGGTTSTAIKYSNEKNPYQQNKKAQDALALRGANLDLAV